MKFTYVIISLFLICVLVGCSTPQPTTDVSAIYTAAFITALAKLPTSTITPLPPTDTSTPIPPTPTLLPTANPNLIESGTYIIGKDIKPGLYEGQAGTNSCYWARLKDVSGNLDSILANENSVGQYYIRVDSTDYALQTDCELLLLTSLPKPSMNMPTKIDSGMYLVGIDIQPGTYKGQAGKDTCYWARLNDVGGNLSSIITNDNSNGQFYIQVSPSDFALTTACPIELVGK